MIEKIIELVLLEQKLNRKSDGYMRKIFKSRIDLSRVPANRFISLIGYYVMGGVRGNKIIEKVDFNTNKTEIERAIKNYNADIYQNVQ